jgi:hypothetical protein
MSWYPVDVLIVLCELAFDGLDIDEPAILRLIDEWDVGTRTHRYRVDNLLFFEEKS